MQHLSNSFYILSVSYSLSASDTDDYYNNLCNRIWPPLSPHMFEISSGNTFLISAFPRTLPLVRYQYIWTLLTCFPIPDYAFEAILEERKVYEKNRRRRSGTFQDLDYICCSTYGRPRSKDFHWKHYKKLLEDNGLPDIRWHDLRSTFCTILLKNNFNPKAVSQLMGHAKEIITIDVYGDTAEIIEDCLDDLQPFIDEVIPKEESESGTDFSEDDYIDNICEFLG